MEKYVNQLIELLQEAQHRRPSPCKLGLPDEMEWLEDMMDIETIISGPEYTMEHIFGVEQYYFPPEERLSDSQIQILITEILNLWHVFHYEADMREGEFTEREVYTKLVGYWKESFPLLRGTNGTWHIELYDYEKDWDEETGEYNTDV